MARRGRSMEKFRVFVVEKSYSDYSLEREIVERAGGTLLFCRCRSEEEIVRQCPDAHALLLRQTAVGEKTFAALTGLRVVARYGAGYDNVDVEAASRHGVTVAIVPDYCVGEVADHTIALLLCAIRKITIRDRMVRLGGWDLGSDYPVHRTDGTILGFVGYGRTAREIRRRLCGFPFRFVAFDPYAPGEVFLRDRTAPLDFDELVRVSHYVTIHVPLTGETLRLFNLDTFRAMRKDAIVVNSSRGGVVDLQDLATALGRGFIGGAALDVYDEEPFDTASPLASLDNVILSDHAAWYSEESQRELQARTAMEAVKVLRGERPDHAVNPEVLTRPRGGFEARRIRAAFPAR